MGGQKAGTATSKGRFRLLDERMPLIGVPDMEGKIVEERERGREECSHLALKKVVY